MLAQRINTLLPPLTAKEALDVLIISSLSNTIHHDGNVPLRPFRAPHHTASAVALTSEVDLFPTR